MILAALNIPIIPASDFSPVIPAFILMLGGIVLLLSEVFLSAPSRSYQAVLATAVCLMAAVVALSNAFDPAKVVLQGFMVADPLGAFLTAMVCVSTAVAVLLCSGFLKHRNAERGEFYALVLFAAAGMSLLGMSAEFITLFINLEILSVATYALTSFLRRGSRPSEAGFKYFILGAFSAAILLYGAALLYGATGTTKLAGMINPLKQSLQTAPALVYAALGLIAAGFAFKIAAVPFHMWTPDVYEGAPTPITALMSGGVKAAAFVAMVRFFVPLGSAVDPRLPFWLFSFLALLTMVGGNLMAMTQRNVKRMLAYSSIAHAGYLLVGVAALFGPQMGHGANVGVLQSTPVIDIVSSLQTSQNDAIKGILFYLLGYTFTSLGAFGVLSALERREDETKTSTWDLERLSGLAQRRPGWALVMAVCMLSLGGIPPTVGFLGKLLLFRSAVDAGLLGLAVVGVLASAVGVYYYLRVVVYMYMRNVPEDAGLPVRHWTTETALVFSAVAVVALGVLPGTVTDWLAKATLLLSP